MSLKFAHVAHFLKTHSCAAPRAPRYPHPFGPGPPFFQGVRGAGHGPPTLLDMARSL